MVRLVQSPVAPTRMSGRGAVERGELDVVGSVAQAGGVFADATALEVVRDHDHGGRDGDARIEGGEQKCLRAAAGFAGAADARRVDTLEGG